eukprot:5457599-Prymnesium_polylepis.1
MAFPPPSPPRDYAEGARMYTARGAHARGSRLHADGRVGGRAQRLGEEHALQRVERVALLADVLEGVVHAHADAPHRIEHGVGALLGELVPPVEQLYLRGEGRRGGEGG